MRVDINRQLAGLEDLLFGVGTVEQNRQGETVVITKINASNMPFDGVNSLQDKIDEIDIIRDSAQSYSLDALSYSNSAQTYANNSSTSATNASNSANSASTSATNAQTYRNSAQTYSNNSSASATAASGYATTALGYKNTTYTYMDNAQIAAASAAQSLLNTEGFSQAASDSAQEALGYRNDTETIKDTVVNTEASISPYYSDIYTLANIATDIITVSTNISAITTASTNMADIQAIADEVAKVVVVANDLNEVVSEIEVVANNIDLVNTAGLNITGINTVSTNITSVNTVASISSDVSAVSDNSTDISTLALVSSDIPIVASISSDVTSVSSNNVDISSVAGNISDIVTVAGINTDITTVAGVSSDIVFLATNWSDKVDTIDIGVTVQAYNANTVIDASYIHTDNNFTSTLKTKLDGIASGAEVNVGTNIGQGTLTTTTVPLTSSTGTGTTLPAATTLLAGVMSSTDKSKLDGIASGAEVNVNADWNAASGDAQILNKPTLGTASAQNVSYFATAAQGAKADTALQPASIGVAVQGYSANTVITDSTQTLTNKTIEDVSNWIGANHLHYKVKATEALTAGNIVMAVGYNSGEDAYEVAKWTTASGKPAIGIAEQSISNGSFGRVVQAGIVKDIDTSTLTLNAIHYPADNGLLTVTKPTTGTYQACVYVMRVHSSQGALLASFNEPISTINKIANDLGTTDFTLDLGAL